MLSLRAKAAQLIKLFKDVTNTLNISPGSKEDAALVAEPDSYYFEADIKFKAIRNGRSRSIFLGFNYDPLNANGKDTPLEVVALRLLKMKLCAQFLTVIDGKSTHKINSRK